MSTAGATRERVAPSIQDTRAATVARVIQTMSDRVDEPHELRDIAQRAFMSPFHFHRVFQMITSSTPGRFLTALRMAKAKRLLLETDLTSTEVSIAVGYSSFGTFTTQFNKLVGMPPGRFRSCAAPISDIPVRVLLEQLAGMRKNRPRDYYVGVDQRPDGLPSYAVIGSFGSIIPQACPDECAVCRTPGEVDFSGPFRGRRILAVSAHPDATVADLLTECPAADLCVGVANRVNRGAGAQAVRYRIALRRRRITDPPIIVGFPLLGTSAL